MVYGLNENAEFDFSEAIECKEAPLMEGALNIVVESEENYNTIIKAIGISELAYYEKTGEEMIYEAGKISSFVKTVKKHFLIVWKKIKGLFQKFFALLNSYVRSDKAFVEKYKDKVSAPAGYKYKGFAFDVSAVDLSKIDSSIDSIITNVVPGGNLTNASEADAALQKLQDKQGIVEKMNGAAVGSPSVSRGELFKELYKKLRSGKDVKSEIPVNASAAFATISTAQDLIKAAKDNYSALENSIKDAIDKASKFEKGLSDDAVKSNDANTLDVNGKFIRVMHGSIELLKERINILQIANGAKLSAIKDSSRQAKAIVVSLVGNTKKPKATNEGAEFEDDFLSGIVLK